MSRHHDAIKNDPRWKAAKLACKERDDYRCVRCDSTEDLSVDHILPLSEYPELAFELENLQTLCRDCHTDKNNEKMGELVRNTWINPNYKELLDSIL